MPSTFAWAVYRGQTHGSAPTTKALKFLCIEIAEASCLGAACGQARCLTYISLKWEFLYTIKLQETCPGQEYILHKSSYMLTNRLAIFSH